MVEPDSELSGSAHFAFAGTALSRGRLTEALRHFELTATLTTADQWWSVGTRPDLHGLAWSAHAHWLAGDAAAARTVCRDAVRLARAIDPYNLAVALAYAAITHYMCGDLTELRAAVDELGELCARHDFAYYPEWGTIIGAWSEPDGSGEERARLGIANLTAAGSFARMPYWLSLLADIQSRGGRPAAARATLDAGIVAARARGDVWWLPELLRQRARHDDGPGVVERLRSAVRLAEEQGSTALRERSERDLDELTVRPGR
jgi:ATP/maltotriose-dependent transcriptional regulator MalT